MNSVSEILADHKRNLPKKHDRKGQPNIVGSDELPQPIAITDGQRKGSHQNWYSENILDIALALYSPEENTLIFPDFLPTSEKTYTCL